MDYWYTDIDQQSWSLPLIYNKYSLQAGYHILLACSDDIHLINCSEYSLTITCWGKRLLHKQPFPRSCITEIEMHILNKKFEKYTIMVSDIHVTLIYAWNPKILRRALTEYVNCALESPAAIAAFTTLNFMLLKISFLFYYTLEDICPLSWISMNSLSFMQQSVMLSTTA